MNHANLQESHYDSVLNAAQKSKKTILFIQDKSELDYSSKKQTSGLGPIGNHKGRGIHIQTTLAVEYDKKNVGILGLTKQKAWIRENISYRKQERRSERYKRSTEADIWRESLENIIKPENSKSLWVAVGDRGNDIYDFISFCEHKNWNFLVRAKNNRKVIAEGKKVNLINWAKTLPSEVEKDIKLRGRDGNPAKSVTVQVSWGKVSILTPKNGYLKSEAEELDVWVLHAWEDALDGLEWFLLTNVPIANQDEALEKICWYETRWTIEEYHKCLKTGCAIEKRQLQTAQGLLAVLGVLGIIATKLLAMKFFAREHPLDKASKHIPLPSLHLICAYFTLSVDDITYGEFWRRIAKLGGFIGRKSDGDPGWQTLWKGWYRFLDMQPAQMP